MMKLILESKWIGFNSPRMSLSGSSGLSDFMASGGGVGHEQVDSTHSIYNPVEDLPTDSTGYNSTDYSTRQFHSEGDFDPENGNNTTATMFSNFGDESIEYIFDRSDVRAIFLILYTIVFCSCFFGNLMVILVVTLHWRMRSITNFCLANLAFADLCVGIFCVYQNIVTYLMDSWVFGEFMCKMYHFINSLSTTASVLILVVICIERYLAIIHPMTCKQMLTLNRLRITIVFVWILSAAISSPRFYYFSTISMPLPNDQYEILCLPNRTKYNSKLMDMISMTVLFLIPLAIITILYTHIGIVLWKSSKNRMPTSSTPSASVESSTSSGCYYRETDHNIIQTVKLTLLPVAVSSSQQQQKDHHYPISGLNLPTPPPTQRRATSSAQQPERSSSLSFPSPFICFQCGNKSKKNQRQILRRASSSRTGRMKEVQNVNGTTPSPIGSRPCKNCMANVAINEHATGVGGGTGHETVQNCKACNHPYVHHQQLYYPPGMIIPSLLSTDEPVQTTSFIKCCHNHKENGSCVTLARNSRSVPENLQHCTRNKATSSPIITRCCGGREKRPRNIFLRKHGSPEKAVTFETDKNKSPPSPFCNRNCSCTLEGKSSTTEPIVLVKFEKRKKQSKKKGSRKSQCTILMNTKSCHGSDDFAGTTSCNGSGRSEFCGGVGGSMDSGDGVDIGRSQVPDVPSSKFDCALCHPQSSIECCGESRGNGNDNHITGSNVVGKATFSELHHRRHHNNSLQKFFFFEHKRNLSTDSGISGMRSTTGRANIEGGSCDQNFDDHEYVQIASGACGNSCPSCGATCMESHQISRCHRNHQPNLVPSCGSVGSQKLCHFAVSNGSTLPGVTIAAPSAPKRIRRLRVVRSSKYGTSALLSRRRIIRMLIVVVLAFALCHLPFHARKVWQYWSPTWAQYQGGSVFSTLFTPITFLIMYANSAINPILYAFMSKKFRMSFKDLLCCKMRHSLRISRNASVRSTHAVAV